MMNNKFSKTLIKHCNAYFLTLKEFINRFQNFWKLHIFSNLLHKPWHNNIKKIIKKFWNFLKNILRNMPSKASKCSLCYFVCTLLHPFTTSPKTPWGFDMKLYITNTFHETNIWWPTFRFEMHQPLPHHSMFNYMLLTNKKGSKLRISSRFI
jgi:hypothetical protein